MVVGPNGGCGLSAAQLAVTEDCRAELENAANQLLPTVESCAKEFTSRPICAAILDLVVCISIAFFDLKIGHHNSFKVSIAINP